jgi:16S rRNA (guanine(1405)-N(7))-methyltransferase
MSLVIEKIYSKIKESKKYKDLYEKTVFRVAEDCVKRYGEKHAEEKARMLLHQIWGAYYHSRPDFEKLLPESFLEKISFSTSIDEILDLRFRDIRDDIGKILQLHSSTKERLPILNDFYNQIFAITGQPDLIIDHACGLNPLAFISVGNGFKPFRYQAYDIDKAEIDFLNKCFEKLGLENFHADLGDVLYDLSESDTRNDLKPFHTGAKNDITFLFKLLPVLEQQEKGSSKKLLQSIQSKFIVVSYPIKSIGGKEKGMAEFYSGQFEEMAGEMNLKYQMLLFQTELVFVISNFHL